MSQAENQVLQRVKAKWLAEVDKDVGGLVARWKVSTNGLTIARMKSNKRDERWEKSGNTWMLKGSKWEGGRWVANDKQIIPIQQSRYLKVLAFDNESNSYSGRKSLSGMD